ncbi:MAG: hypothetical protein ABI476_10735, partial [Oxalobacteraceae bacterium]
ILDLLFATAGCILLLTAADLWTLLFLCCAVGGVTSLASAAGAEKATNTIEKNKANADFGIITSLFGQFLYIVSV